MADTDPPPSLPVLWTRAAIAALPVLSESLMIVFDGLSERRAARMTHALEAVAEAYPDPSDLADRLAGDEALDVLVSRVVLEAGRTSIAAKRRLLGRVAAEALRDDANVDHAMLVTLVLEQIDTPHVRVLTTMEAHSEDYLPADESEPAASETARSNIDALSLPVRVVLESLGLIETNGIGLGEGSAAQVTGFGLQLLDDLGRDGVRTSAATE